MLIWDHQARQFSISGRTVIPNVPKLIKRLPISLSEAENTFNFRNFMSIFANSVTLDDTENPKSFSPKCNMPILKLYEPELTIIPPVLFLRLKFLKSACLLRGQKKNGL
jgi:hypothetical protein